MRTVIFSCVALAMVLPSAAPAQNRVLALDGVSAYAFAVLIGGFSPSELTVEVWFRGDAPPAGTPRREQRIVSKGSETFQSLLDGRFSVVYIEDGTGGPDAGRIRFNVYLGSFLPTMQVQLDSMNTFPAGQWTHISATYSGISGQANLYVNGVLEGSTTTASNGTSLLGTTMTSTPQPLAFGAVPFPNALGPTAFRGQIDEVRLWSVERSPAAITSDITNSIVTAPGLIQSYQFEGNANGNSSMGMPFNAAFFPIAFVPGYGGGAFPAQAECQVATPAAALEVGPFTGDAGAPAFSTGAMGVAVLSSNAGAMPWDVGVVTSAFPVPLAGGGAQVSGSQILNIDLADPSFTFVNGGTFSVPFNNPLAFPYAFAPTSNVISGQFVIIDATSSAGFSLSNPAILAPGL